MTAGHRHRRVRQEFVLLLSEPLPAAECLRPPRRRGSSAPPGVSTSSFGIACERSISSQAACPPSSIFCMSPSAFITLAIVAATRDSLVHSHRDHEPVGVGAERLDVAADHRDPLPRLATRSFSTSICGPSGSSLSEAITSS